MKSITGSSSLTSSRSTELTALEGVDAHSLAALNRLIRFKAEVDQYPVKRRAAVLICLFMRNGQLNTILSTRSQRLRTHPGQVSLPGGKADEGDVDLEFTARREAFEEIGLPLDPINVVYLTTLDTVLSPNDLLVTPIVVFLRDNKFKPILNESEVADIFSHPLAFFLHHTLPPTEALNASFDDPILSQARGDRQYHTATDYSWKERPPHRFHSFTSRRGKSITGFTAGILIQTAELAFDSEPDFIKAAPGSLTAKELIELSLRQPIWKHHPGMDKEIETVQDGLKLPASKL